jgi:hypothetical protein
MPSPSKRLCVFGDSHFACVKMAVDEGLVDLGGFDVEFWGNLGTQFRHLTWRNDQIEPLDDFTAGRFAKTNVHGRKVLDAKDFDVIFFMGCRIDIYRLFPEALHRRRTPEQHLSSGVETRWFTDFIRRQPPFQFAQGFAAQGQAQVFAAPVSFDTEGFDETIPDDFAAAREATETDRAALWQTIREIMAEDGVILVPQPEETVVSGCCTDPRFAVAKYKERNDRTHKNSQYGALILNRVLDGLRNS